MPVLRQQGKRKDEESETCEDLLEGSHNHCPCMPLSARGTAPRPSSRCMFGCELIHAIANHLVFRLLTSMGECRKDPVACGRAVADTSLWLASGLTLCSYVKPAKRMIRQCTLSPLAWSEMNICSKRGLHLRMQVPFGCCEAKHTIG